MACRLAQVALSTLRRCGCGGIGRRGRFKICFLRKWEFESPHPHHMQLHNMLIILHIYKILTLSGTFFGTLLA